MELILDASSRASRVGLSTGGTLRWFSRPLAPQEHTREFLPALLQGMRTTDTTASDIRAIVVALGPGPFNGLRVAVSTAKGLAEGTGAPIVGIPTLEAEAARCTPGPHPIRPVVAAGRSNFTTALFAWADGMWCCVEAARHADVAELAPRVTAEVLICGEVEEFRAALQAVGLPPTPFTTADQCSRMEVLARMGWERYRSGDTVPSATLQPLYVNPPHITIPRDRRL